LDDDLDYRNTEDDESNEEELEEVVEGNHGTVLFIPDWVCFSYPLPSENEVKEHKPHQGRFDCYLSHRKRQLIELIHNE
jgi:hypothetical protein